MNIRTSTCGPGSIPHIDSFCNKCVDDRYSIRRVESDAPQLESYSCQEPDKKLFTVEEGKFLYATKGYRQLHRPDSYAKEMSDTFIKCN